MLDQFKKHSHWKGAAQVCSTLSKSGFKAYLAGGCVRDAILGRKINDFDIATDAHPDQVLKLFPGALDIGIKFGTVIVVFKDDNQQSYQIEVTTFRSDGDYLDGRRPEGYIKSTPREDAMRRDFTINALFYSFKQNKIIDFVNGQKDLKSKKLVAVGEAELRFKEDHLRILRGLRFSAQLGFDLEEQTLKAMSHSASSLSKISKERIQIEITKLFKAHFAFKVCDQLKSTGVWGVLFPQLTFVDNKALWGRFKNSLATDIANLNIVYASLFYLQAQHEALNLDNYIQFLKEAKYSKAFTRHLKNTLDSLMSFSQQSLSQQIRSLGSSCGAEVLQLLTYFSVVPDDELAQTVKSYLIVADDTGLLPDNFVSAQDLMDQGYKGAQIGELLDKLYDLQLTGVVNSRREALIKLAVL